MPQQKAVAFFNIYADNGKKTFMTTNKYVYIELLRQVCPYNQPFISFNYFLLGSFDAMFIDTDNSIDALKKKYENRYSEVLSVFDRQPVYMYSKDPVDINDRNCIFNTSDSQNDAIPLVLTLFQLDKLSLAKRKIESPEKLINEFSDMLAEYINPEHVAFQVFWNLGESDIVTVFRTDYLNELASILHSLRVNGLSDETINIISTSSHCAFPRPSIINSETCKDPEKCKNLLRSPLEEWLLKKDDNNNKRYNGSDFITLGNVASNDEPQFHTDQFFSFLFGEWDYMLQFNGIDDLITHLCDTFACLVTADRQLSSYAPFRVSYTIPMFQLGTETNAVKDQQSQGITDPTKTEGQAGDCSLDKESLIPSTTNLVHFSDDLSASMDALHTYVLNNFSIDRRENLCKEINSFKNSLNGLGKFLYRLRIGRFEEDLYTYIQPVFERLAAITKNYTANIKDYMNAGNQADADNLVIEYLEDTSLLIENLQHLFSIMAVSPHTYMETYGSNMRSLAAADKLLNSYQGIIKFLKDSFPDRYIHNGEPKSSRREILIFPYRKTQSSHTLLYRHSHPADRLSYISLDFSKMFDPTGTIFMLLHECGHHLGNRLREERFRLFYAALVCDILYKAGVEKFIQTPIGYLVQIIGQKNAYARTDISGSSLLFQGLDAKEREDLSKKYEERIRKDIGDYTYSIGVSCKKDSGLIANYKAFIKVPIFPYTVDLWNNYYSAQILEYLKAEQIPQYFGVDKQEMSFERIEYMKKALRDTLTKAIANPLKEITKQLADDIAQHHGNTREALRIKTMYADTEQIVSDLIDPLEQIISDSWNNDSYHVLLSIFSNIYSDLFAIAILDLNQEEYLDVIKKLLGIERIGLITSNNLLRFYAVCESKWNNTDVSIFADIFKIDMSADGKKRWELIQYNPYYPFLLEYAKDCLKNLEKDVEEKKNIDPKPFNMLKDMTSEGNDNINSIYYFYQYLMGERKAQT